MGKRVFEFAKELGLQSKEVLDRCRKLGHMVPNQLTVVDEKVQADVRRDLGLVAEVAPAAAPTSKIFPAGPPARPAPPPPAARPGRLRKISKPGVGPGAPSSPPASSRIVTRTAAPPPGFTRPMPARSSRGRGLAAGKPIARPAPHKSEAPPKETEVSAAAPGEPQIVLQVAEGITVTELAQKLNVKPSVLIKEMMDLGILATINQRLDLTVAETLASAHNARMEAIPAVAEELREEEPDDPKDLKPRPPVVTIMGHVDHGKTLLLDAIRSARVAEGEAGGITQHIGAYQVRLPQGAITFLDTPGHEAFTTMRARGVKVTDIVVLVVAADDGVMPQTLEAIDHAKEAKVPIVVAVNKIDKPEANPDRVKAQLAERGLQPEEWGGKTIFVEVSAKKKQNIEKLLEMTLLEAEILELKANPKKRARGVVLEARLDKGRGPVATLLVEDGTLKAGDVLVAGATWGRVRAMHDDHGRTVKAVPPATPAEVLGLSGVPEAGDTFVVVEDPKRARELASKRGEALKDNRMVAPAKHINLENLFEKIQEGQVKELKVIVKGDVQGSVEALTASLEKIPSEKVALRVIHGATGDITNSDILLAAASDAIVLGFNVKVDGPAKETAEREKVDVRLYKVIYDVVEDVRKAMEGLLEPTYQDVLEGRFEVRQPFKTPKGWVAGGVVQSGRIARGLKAKVLRDGQLLIEGKIESLRRFKDDVKEVAAGFECGLTVTGYEDVKEGDVVEAYVQEEVAQKLT